MPMMLIMSLIPGTHIKVERELTPKNCPLNSIHQSTCAQTQWKKGASKKFQSENYGLGKYFKHYRI